MNYFTVQCFFRPFLTLLLQIFLNYRTWLFLPFYQTSIFPQHFKQFLAILFVHSFYITRRPYNCCLGPFYKISIRFCFRHHVSLSHVESQTLRNLERFFHLSLVKIFFRGNSLDSQNFT